MNTLKTNQIFLLFLLFFVTFITFFNAIDAKFANLDDSAMVILNKPTAKDLTIKNIANIFTLSHEGLYHPLVTLFYALERHFFGLIPSFYHFDNILLHLFNTLLVFLVFFNLSKSFWTPYIIATLFAIHPAHVEAVAWISARKDTLYSLFYLLSILFYIKSYDVKNKRILIFLSFFCFILACFSKVMAITLPFILILIDYFKYKITIQKVKIYSAYFIISISFAILAVYIHYPENYIITSFTNTINILNAHFNTIFYIYKFIVPTNLYCMYPDFYNQFTMPPAYIMYSPTILYLMILFVFLSLKKTKYIFFGFMFFFITILPVSGIMKVGFAPVADRYTYLPYIGLSYVVAETLLLLYKSFNNFFKILLIVSGITIFVTLSYLSYNRTLDWKNNDFKAPLNMKYYTFWREK